MPLHVAIVRRVRPGCEAQFQQALREFFQASFAHGGVLGATMILPAPGGTSREYGILRTFENEQERDSFYQSQAFRDWDLRCAAWVEPGPWSARTLHGLEAWFRESGAATPPPKWKMTVATYLGVFPLATVLNLTLGPWLLPLPFVLRTALFNAAVVVLLSWVIMPLVVRLLHPWLHSKAATRPPAA